MEKLESELESSLTGLESESDSFYVTGIFTLGAFFTTYKMYKKLPKMLFGCLLNKNWLRMKL